jgi:hypothetical protein
VACYKVKFISPVETKCINVRIVKLLKKSTTCFGPFLGGHHQVDTRISDKTHILQRGHPEWGTEISFYNVWGGE